MWTLRYTSLLVRDPARPYISQVRTTRPVALPDGDLGRELNVPLSELVKILVAWLVSRL